MNIKKALVIALLALSLALGGIAASAPAPVEAGCTTTSCWG